MEDLFESAKFGDMFRTRGGRKALYLQYCYATNRHELISDDLQDIECTDNGLYYEDDDSLDIVSRWEETIDEDELNKLANKICPFFSDDSNIERQDWINGFKDGYRKAKEE